MTNNRGRGRAPWGRSSLQLLPMQELFELLLVFPHTHAGLCRAGLPWHRMQRAVMDPETGAACWPWSPGTGHIGVLPFNREKGKGLHLMKGVKRCPDIAGTFSLRSIQRTQRIKGSKSWQMQAWYNALAPSKTLSWKWYLGQGRRNQRFDGYETVNSARFRWV